VAQQLQVRVAERDGQIAALNQTLAERDAYRSALEEVKQSTFWWITAPMRLVRRATAFSLRLAKRRLELLLRRNTPAVVATTDGGKDLHYWIDEAVFVGRSLRLQGWAYREGSMLAKAFVVLGKRESTTTVDLTARLRRLDVAAVLCAPEARLGGFAGQVAEALGALTLALGFVFEDGSHARLSLSVAAIPRRGRFLRLRALAAALDRRRIHLALKLVLRGDFNTLRRKLLRIANEQPRVEAREVSLRDALAALRSGPQPIASTKPVSILIPVYNGFEHCEHLFDSLFAHTAPEHQVIVVDDGSTDCRVRPYLEARVAERANTRLLVNERNLGFVATINRAAAQLREGDFIILNSDVVVPPFWVEKLMRPFAHREARVASATPFSNAATIFSWPQPGEDNPLPEGLSVDEINAVFARLDPTDGPDLDVPTGAGFCMGINGEIWRRIGGFDAALFGRGYGEENDWCCRAMREGYRNVLVPDLFVSHVHGGSFAPEEKKAAMAKNLAVLARRWPEYLRRVEDHVARDPWVARRGAATLALVLALEARALVVFDHAVGGGANAYRRRRVEKALGEGRGVCVLTYNQHSGRIDVEARRGTLLARFEADDVRVISALAQVGAPERILLNCFVFWESPQAAIRQALALASLTGARVELVFHEYFLVCPSYLLLGRNGHFCGVPKDLNVCESCLPSNINAEAGAGMDFRVWRALGEEVIAVAHDVIFFSRASRDLVARAFALPETKVVIRPHTPLHVFDRPLTWHGARPLTVGVVGSIGRAKGADVVIELARLLERRRPDARVVVIGELDRVVKQKNLQVTGTYELDRLAELLEANGVTIAFFSSICPETFSYVTQELMQLRLPLVCFDLGAQAERVRDYAYGRIAAAVTAEAALDAILELERMMLRLGGREVSAVRGPHVA